MHPPPQPKRKPQPRPTNSTSAIPSQVDDSAVCTVVQVRLVGQPPARLRMHQSHTIADLKKLVEQQLMQVAGAQQCPAVPSSAQQCPAVPSSAQQRPAAPSSILFPIQQ